MPAYTGAVFSFAHNWVDPVTETIGYLTTVLRKRSGLEQRIRIRQQPRRTLLYRVFLGGEGEYLQRRRFDAFLRVNQDQNIMIPIWQDAQPLPAQVASGSGHINLPSLSGYDFGAGAGYLIFWRSDVTYEVLKITALNNSTGQITFDTNTVSTWPAGTFVMPAWLGIFDPVASDEVFASDFKQTQVKFEITIPTTPATASYRAIDPALDVYRTVDIFTTPGMDGSNERTVERSMQRRDFQAGQVSNDSIQAAPFGSVDCKVDLSGRDEIAAFLGWLANRQGRQKGFWFPSWEQDFENVAFTLTATEFEADSFKYTSLYAAGESRRDIVFVSANGDMLPVRILSSTDDGTTETFEVDSAVSGVDLNTLDRVSFLRYCRLDHDEIELTWDTTEDVSIGLKFRELIRTA
jgi:hypothetical protein